MRRPTLRRATWYGAWAAALLWLARVSLVPARPRGARLTGVSGVGPYYAGLRWSYGPGARPVSVIFDLEAGPAVGSATTDGEATEAEIPLGAAPSGRYHLTISATYRIAGFAHTIVIREEGVTPEGHAPLRSAV